MKKGIIVGLILGIILPWILIFIFLNLLTDINWTQVTGGIPQYLAILSFGSVAFPYNVPIFGYGFVIPLLIWIMTGLICGLFSKSALMGAVLTLVGLVVNVVLFIALPESYIPAVLITGENAGLLGGITLEFFVTLGLFLGAYSLTAPGGALGGMLGGLISRSPVAE